LLLHTPINNNIFPSHYANKIDHAQPIRALNKAVRRDNTLLAKLLLTDKIVWNSNKKERKRGKIYNCCQEEKIIALMQQNLR
jgi:hypothetical protein